MKWTPHNYQCEAMSFRLSRPGSGLFMDPGLGKTSICLSTTRMLRDLRNSSTLIIAPLPVCGSTWPDEIAKWSNFGSLKYTLLHGKHKWERLWQPADIYGINPEGIKALHGELLRGLKAGNKLPFNDLIVDESTKFKNATGTYFNLLKDMLPLFKTRCILTGTPSPKSMLDLWAQVYILDNGKALGDNYYHFRNKYFYTEDWNQYDWKLKDFTQEQILEKISHLILNMDAKKHLDIPPLIENKINVEMPAECSKAYKELESEMLTTLSSGEEITSDTAAQLSLKCRQYAMGRIYEDIPEDLDDESRKKFMLTRKTLKIHKAKLDALKRLVAELNGKPLLVAYNFKHDLEAIREAFGDIPFIGGGAPAGSQQQIIKDWNAGKIPILAGNPASMAHGLNLQKGGNDLCWYSPTWNLELYQQFNTRIYRQGVKGTVRIHSLICAGTIEEVMEERLSEKSSNQLSIRNSIEKFYLGSK